MSHYPEEAGLNPLQVLNLLQNPIWIFDIKRLQMRWANRASLHLWNATSLDDLLSRNFKDVSESTQIRLQTYLRQFEQGQTLIEQWTFYPEGQPISIPCRCSGIEIEPGHLAMLVEGLVDSSQQVDQDTLRSIEALRHTSVMISLYTLEGVAVLRNPAALRCYGETTRVDGTQKNEFLSRFVEPEVRQQADRALDQGQVFSIETQVHTLAGIRWHGLDARLTNDPVTGKTMILVNEKDITVQQIALTTLKETEIQLRQTNEELAQATRLKDEFLANMSHELRTPLNAILGMAEGLQEQIFGEINQEQIRALQTIESSGSHLLELINDILDVAKIESGQITLEPAAVAIAPLCQSSLVFLKQQALKKHIQLEIQLPPPSLDLPNLWIDERRIRQVLINLLNNAVKFTPQGGRVTLSVALLPQSDDKTFLRIAVTDTGIGIAPENLSKLFKPFIQIDSALNREYAGTGLGLALVKRIVELHGGQVGVTSTLGIGSCFTIDLPCLAAHCSYPPTPGLPDLQDSTQIAVGRPPLILLAEDNEAIRSTTASYLKAKGYRVLLARSGQATIDLAQSQQPDLILLDMHLPGMDGLEVVKQIRHDQRLAEVPIIATNALVVPGQECCLATGANDYLKKPFKLKQLMGLMQPLLPS